LFDNTVNSLVHIFANSKLRRSDAAEEEDTEDEQMEGPADLEVEISEQEEEAKMISSSI